MKEGKGPFKTIHELDGKDIIDGAKDVFDDVVRAAKKIIKKGNNCRVRLLNKKRKQVFSTTLTVGTVGFTVVFLLLPLLTLLVTLGALLTEHTIVIEEQVVKASK